MCTGFEVIPLMLDKDENKGKCKDSQNHVCHCGGGKFARRMEDSEIRLSYRACVDRSESPVGFLRA
jgi:hypothetical protein